MDLQDKKKNGIYYTPKGVVKYILNEILLNHDIVKNPEPKILDLSCGCGNFLLEVYKMLYKLIESNMDNIKSRYGDNYIEDINHHIITKCIYGIDIDKEAISILRNALKNKIKHINNEEKNISIINKNISCEDALKKNYYIKFDYIVGNPPYVGHKMLDKNYKKFLYSEYKEVYKDKADLYFCFYKKSLELIKDNGKIGIITPRYFLESPSGKLLRNYLFYNSKIYKMIDLNGVNVFNNIGISTLIIIFKKKQKEKIKEYNNNIITIYRTIEDKLSLYKINDLQEVINDDLLETIKINQETLRQNWIIANDKDRVFFNKIEEKCDYRLEDIATSFQGIITGCDKAFILNKDDERINYIDKNLLNLWIKNKNVNQYIIEESNQRIIYSNDIEDINDYPYIEENCFNLYKSKLKNRRECLKNLRKWYQLQWGREKSLFERKKIMYPYKSKNNRFGIDYNNSFCSADVYSFFIKEEYNNIFSYEYLVALLNSEVYDRYFKITAKCMGNQIYDYYPNKVMKIKVFKDDNYYEIEETSKKIISTKFLILENTKYDKLQGKNNTINKEIYYLESEIHFLENRIINLINKSLKL